MSVSNVQINPVQNYKVSFSLGGSDPANTPYSGTIYRNQTDVVGIDQIYVPPNQIWKVVDFNIYNTTTPDLTVDLLIGGTAQNINLDLNSAALSLGTTRLNVFALMANGGMYIAATTSLQVQAVSQAANGTAAQTIYAKLVVAAFPIAKQ